MDYEPKNQKTKKERINTHIPRLGGLWSESTFFEDFFKLHLCNMNTIKLGSINYVMFA